MVLGPPFLYGLQVRALDLGIDPGYETFDQLRSQQLALSGRQSQCFIKHLLSICRHGKKRTPKSGEVKVELYCILYCNPASQPQPLVDFLPSRNQPAIHHSPTTTTPCRL